MRQVVIVLGIVLILLSSPWSWPAAPVAACACPDPPTPQVAVTQASAVFLGRVQSITTQHPAGQNAFQEVTFAVSARWKGTPGATVRVIGPAFCENDFESNQEYLVYAEATPLEMEQVLGLGAGQFLRPIPCSRTNTAQNAVTDLVILGKGTPTQPNSLPGLPNTGNALKQGDWRPTLLLASICIFIGLWIQRRQTRQ